ncbi:LysR family transcriptional regulator [Actinomadura opuntiae]|uniref:LysR family transcriptional regulator n=1 Tax=Actinomadura sp. OS1-43 TaxID=604315 RepID=UPI00255B0323|nr:LysR family transcriptional regulator [Actinomadura sp. OS1-43]MDL4814149.1 LysR family transcriptional regulator [Actinomadura sp. OS1-43]
MEIRQLRCFVAVVDEGGFARAADRLRIVQPAVSQQVARLERELGVPLFDRSRRTVRLTGPGERLLPEARALLAAEARIREVASGIAGGLDGVLRLGTSQGLGDRIDLVLQHLAGSAPRLRVKLVSATLPARLEAVRSGEYDAAFVRVLDSAPGLELLPVWSEGLVAVLPASHPLAAAPLVRLEDLAELPLRLAARADNQPLCDLITAACRAAGFTPAPGPPFTNLQDSMAEIGTAAASWTVLYAAAAEHLPQRRVAVRPLDGPAVTTHLAVRGGPPTPTLRLLLDACAAVGSLQIG